MSFTNLQNKTLSILGKTTLQTQAGQIKNVWAVLQSDVICRMSEAPKNFTVEDTNYKVTKETFIFFLSPSLDGAISKENRITYQSKEYYIVKISAFQGKTNIHHLEVYAQVISVGGQSGLQSGLSVDTSIFVPKTTTVNGKPLSSNITIGKLDIPDLVTDLNAKQNISTNYDDRSLTQSFNLQNIIVVTHNFTRYPSVTIFDTAGDEIIGDIVHASANQFTVTFSVTVSGVIYCS